MTIKYHNELEGVPSAIGPYSQATELDGIVYLSGQIPIDPSRSALVEGGIEEQTEQVMKNISHALEGLGLSFANVLKTTILLADLGNFQKVNQIYASWLGEARPARATYQVAGLPMGSMVEIEMIAKRS